MTAKSLKHFNREALLRLLIECATEKEILQKRLNEKENELVCQQQQAATNSTLSAGSLATEALHVHHIFEAAQETADQYLDEIKKMKDACETSCSEAIMTAQIKANAILEEAQNQADTLKEQTAEQCNQLQLIAEHNAVHNWTNLNKRLDQVSESLTELLSIKTPQKKGRQK